MRNPWSRARAAEQRAEALGHALRAAVVETQRIVDEQVATARLLAQAEDVVRRLQDDARRHPDVRSLRTELRIKDDVIAAMDERLRAAERAQLHCDAEHSPLVRVRALRGQA